MPQSYSYWRWVHFVRSDPLIRSAIARWRLAGVEWLRAIFAIFLAPVPACRCQRAPWFFSCPSSSVSRSHSRMFCHAFLCPRHSVSGEPRVVQPFILARYPPQGKAYPDNEWSSRSSSIAIRCQEGVSGPRVIQAFIFTRYPPRKRIRTPSGQAVHLSSLSAARKAYPDPEWSSRPSSLAIRRQEGVSGPRVVQPFIFTRYPLPGRRIRTPRGPAVHLSSVSAARKAHPDPEWSSRPCSLAIRRQEGVSGPRLVQVFIFTRYPPPGSRIRTPSGPAVHLHSLFAAWKAYPDPEGSRRLSLLAIRRQEGISWPRVVRPFLFTGYPLPGRRIQTAGGPGVHLNSLSPARKAYPDKEWSRRPSSLAIHCQVGVSGPRVVQPFIFTRFPPLGNRIGT